MRQETMGFRDGSGISWTICKQSAPCSRQITTATPYHWIFYRPDALAQPTVSKHGRQVITSASRWLFCMLTSLLYSLCSKAAAEVIQKFSKSALTSLENLKWRKTFLLLKVNGNFAQYQKLHQLHIHTHKTIQRPFVRDNPCLLYTSPSPRD